MQSDAQNYIPLESIRIASPCNADWNAMQGDDRARFCGTCRKNVYNLSDMTRAQAQALVARKEGNMCVRMYRRADGTVISDDCPIPMRPARNGARWVWRAASAGIAALSTVCGGWFTASPHAKPARKQAWHAAKAKRADARKKSQQVTVIAGGISAPPEPVKPPALNPVPVYRPDNPQYPGVSGQAAVPPSTAKVIQVPAPSTKTDASAPVIIRGVQATLVIGGAEARVAPPIILAADQLDGVQACDVAAPVSRKSGKDQR